MLIVQKINSPVICGDPGSSMAASSIGVGDVDDRGYSPDVFLIFFLLIIMLFYFSFLIIIIAVFLYYSSFYTQIKPLSLHNV